MGIEIRTPATKLEWENYYDLRFRILRAPFNQPIGSEKNEGDEMGIHFGLYENKILLAIARLDPTEKTEVYQVRFLAVEENQKGKGFGKAIMSATEKKAAESGGTQIILHARESAVPFYKRLNYRLVEKSHLLFGELQHYLMEKDV